MPTFKNRTIATLGAIVATVATVALSSPARAESAQTVVSFADVDLGSAAGKAIVARRIDAAAAKVCGPMDRTLSRTIYACRREAVANAKLSLAASPRVQLASR